MAAYTCPANQAPEVHTDPATEIKSFRIHKMGKTLKVFFETVLPTAYIRNWYVARTMSSGPRHGVNNSGKR